VGKTFPEAVLSLKKYEARQEEKMEEKTYSLKGAGLPPLLGTEALAEAGATDLRVLLALFELGSATAPALAEALGCDEAKVTAALGFWRGAGAVAVHKTSPAPAEVTPAASVPDAPAATPPAARKTELGAAEMADYIRDHALADLIEAAEQQCGRTFNRPDLAALIRLSQDFGLSGAYILTLLSYCDSLGDEKAKAIRYAERVAERLVGDGVTTCAALEEYIKEQEILHSAEGWLRRMFGLGTRRLTPKERDAFLRWTRTYGYGEEIVGAAYDITVAATDRASVAYADKVITHWHEEGVKTVAEAEALRLRERPAKPAAKPSPRRQPQTDGKARSFDVGDFFQRAIDRSYKPTSTDTDGKK
jgi:DnaD/phage-associated family protein